MVNWLIDHRSYPIIPLLGVFPTHVSEWSLSYFYKWTSRKVYAVNEAESQSKPEFWQIIQPGTPWFASDLRFVYLLYVIIYMLAKWKGVKCITIDIHSIHFQLFDSTGLQMTEYFVSHRVSVLYWVQFYLTNDILWRVNKKPG